MGIVDWVYPKMCVGCRKEGEYICLTCRKKLVPPDPICPVCAKPSFDGWTHQRCKTRDGIDRLIVSLPYKGLVQECLKKVKYRSAWEIIGFLYDLSEFPPIEGIVTNVPMWKKKERERGFNQAKILAQLIGNSTDLLERTRTTKPMFGLKKNERRENVKGAFQLNHKSKILKFSNKKIILVDDVWTTGATMRECAQELKKAGIREVWGLALAR